MASCGTITIEQTFDPAAVTQASCNLGDPDTTNVTRNPGDTQKVQTLLRNGNDVDARATVGVYLDGSQEATTTVTVPAGSDSAAVFDVTINDTGTYSVSTEIENVSEA